jgi:hypothetical protein
LGASYSSSTKTPSKIFMKQCEPAWLWMVLRPRHQAPSLVKTAQVRGLGDQATGTTKNTREVGGKPGPPGRPPGLAHVPAQKHHVELSVAIVHEITRVAAPTAQPRRCVAGPAPPRNLKRRGPTHQCGSKRANLAQSSRFERYLNKIQGTRLPSCPPQPCDSRAGGGGKALGCVGTQPTKPLTMQGCSGPRPHRRCRR